MKGYLYLIMLMLLTISTMAISILDLSPLRLINLSINLTNKEDVFCLQGEPCDISVDCENITGTVSNLCTIISGNGSIGNCTCEDVYVNETGDTMTGALYNDVMYYVGNVPVTLSNGTNYNVSIKVNNASWADDSAKLNGQEGSYYQINISAQSCTGTDKVSNYANGIFTCTADVSGGGGFELTYSNYVGSDLSGSSGDLNRQLTADPDLIQIDNFFLHPTIDYTESGGVVTFLNPVWDDQVLTLWVNSSLVSTNYVGSDLSGSSGDLNRVLIHSNTELVVVDNFFLHPTTDYIFNISQVTFLNPVWDDQSITVWS